MDKQYENLVLAIIKEAADEFQEHVCRIMSQTGFANNDTNASKLCLEEDLYPFFLGEVFKAYSGADGTKFMELLYNECMKHDFKYELIKKIHSI